MTMQSLSPADPGNERRSRWIPFTFIAFFLVIFAVNGALVTFAVRSYNGMATDGAYDRGLAYNDILSERDAQDALGWQASVGLEPAGFDSHRVTVTVTDADGHPLPDMLATVQFRRPASQAEDITLDLDRPTTRDYAGTVTLPLPGLWDIRVELLHDGGTYRVDRRVFVADPAT